MAGLLDFVLPAIFSAGDSAKRQIKGLLGDPVGTVKQFINNKNDQAAAHLADVNLSTQGMMAGLLGGQATPEQLAADQRWTQALANGYNPAGMIVWHGSPHNFTKFDASKIGTGEGAQAYGHGLYLAESPEVAKAYRDNLTKPRDPFVMVDDAVFSSPQTFKYGQGAGYAAYDIKPTVGALAKTGAFPESEFTGAQASELIQEAIKTRRSELLMQKGTKAQQALADLNDLEQILKIKPDAIKASTIRDWGSLYKVDLPDEHIAKMLDWDKPLSQQAQAVRDALQSPALGGSMTSDVLSGKVSKPNYTGADALLDIGASLGARGKSAVHDASGWLQQQGIPGIRYLDGGSRGAGQGTSNFVVFPGNEGLLTILERNGVPLR